MDYFLPAEKSYMKPLTGVWPVDLEKWKTLVLGTGEEKIGWTAARDVAKALVRLVDVEDLVSRLLFLASWKNSWC